MQDPHNIGSSTVPPGQVMIRNNMLPGLFCAEHANVCPQSQTNGHSILLLLLQVRQVATGGMHTVAVMDNGSVFTWGVNDEGALGRQTEGPLWEKAEVRGLW